MPEKPLKWKIPAGATHVEILWNEEKGKPQAKFHKAKVADPPPGDPPPGDPKPKPGVKQHLKSLLTGEGDGMFANPQDAVEDDPESDGNGDD
jgi:hypothetical protein